MQALPHVVQDDLLKASKALYITWRNLEGILSQVNSRAMGLGRSSIDLRGYCIIVSDHPGV